MKKIEEIIEKNVSREEAKKLLTKEEFEEFEKLRKMKAVLASMKVAPSSEMANRVMKKIGAADKKPKRFFSSRFNFAFTVALIAVFVGLLIARGFIPPLSPMVPQMQNKSVAPSNNTGGEKNPSPQNENGLRMFSPLAPVYSVKVTVNSKENLEKAKLVVEKYCPDVKDSKPCKIEMSDFNEFVKELEKYGKVTYNKNDLATENKKEKITIKVEVILQ